MTKGQGTGTQSASEYLRRRVLPLLPDLRGKRLLCALSGGADSVGLCYFLRENREALGIELCAAHLDHGLRPESVDDADFAEALCARWGLPFVRGKADVAALVRSMGDGVEAAAREARYAFLYDAADALRCDSIALAQHRDDQAETFLLNALRGSGLRGLRAMAAQHGRLLRPFLALRRDEIRAYVEENGLAFRHDASNDSMDFARNRLRRLMPALESVRPGAAANLARCAETLAEDERALETWTDGVWRALAVDGRLRCADFLAQETAIQARLLRKMAENAGLPQGLSRRQVEALRALAAGPSGRSVDLPKGLVARQEGALLSIRPKRGPEKRLPFEAPLCLDGRTQTPEGVFDCARIGKPDALGAGWPWQIEADAAALVGATIRRRRAGDWIHPLGAPGRKRFKEYCIDKKIPREARDKVLVAKGDEVLFFPGWALSQRLDATKAASWLALAFSPGT